MNKEFTISTKPYLDFKLYNRKNFTIQSGLTVLTGCNGAGKSTVFKIIMKQESISSGTINIRKNATIGMLKQIYEYEETNPNVYTFVR